MAEISMDDLKPKDVLRFAVCQNGDFCQFYTIWPGEDRQNLLGEDDDRILMSIIEIPWQDSNSRNNTNKEERGMWKVLELLSDMLPEPADPWVLLSNIAEAAYLQGRKDAKEKSLK